jgi:ABC-type iron transport system FetAB ATPase subunit
MTDPPFEEGAIINSDIEKVVGLKGCGGSICDGMVGGLASLDHAGVVWCGSKTSANKVTITAIATLQSLTTNPCIAARL